MNSQRKFWNEQQQALRQVLLHTDHFSNAIELFLAQHAMVHSGRISPAALWSFEDEIWQGLPETVARQIPQGDEHSIAWVFWHIARIEDVTMNLLVGGCPQVLDQPGWLERMQVAIRHTGNSMDAAGISDLSASVDLKALRAYRRAVGRRTREIVHHLHPEELKQKVDPV
ncbi:MAG: DinB family protein [Chloroflexi bacterium]|nr:DinB family protein [Chloroflexota bacterium]